MTFTPLWFSVSSVHSIRETFRVTKRNGCAQKIYLKYLGNRCQNYIIFPCLNPYGAYCIFFGLLYHISRKRFAALLDSEVTPVFFDACAQDPVLFPFPLFPLFRSERIGNLAEMPNCVAFRLEFEYLNMFEAIDLMKCFFESPSYIGPVGETYI